LFSRLNGIQYGLNVKNKKYQKTLCRVTKGVPGEYYGIEENTKLMEGIQQDARKKPFNRYSY